MREWGGSDEMEDIVEADRQRREREECNSEAASTLLMLGYSYDGRKWNPPHADGVAIPRKPLTDEQIEQIAQATFRRVQDMPDDKVNGSTWDREFARAIEAHVSGVKGTVASRAPDIRGVDEMDVPAGVLASDWLDEAMKLAENYARAWQHDVDGSYVIKEQAAKAKAALLAHLAGVSRLDQPQQENDRG